MDKDKADKADKRKAPADSHWAVNKNPRKKPNTFEWVVALLVIAPAIAVLIAITIEAIQWITGWVS